MSGSEPRAGTNGNNISGPISFDESIPEPLFDAIRRSFSKPPAFWDSVILPDSSRAHCDSLLDPELIAQSGRRSYAKGPRLDRED
jgi:hypothetical protein